MQISNIQNSVQMKMNLALLKKKIGKDANSRKYGIKGEELSLKFAFLSLSHATCYIILIICYFV